MLLDGLDEIADDTRRVWVVRAIEHFVSRYPQSRVVVTCRTYAYRDAFKLAAPFVSAALQPLEEAAQDDFLARWYRAALLTGNELVGR